jgi:hypothetical protein
MIINTHGDILEPQGEGKKIILNLVNDVGRWVKGNNKRLEKKYQDLGNWSPKRVYENYYLDYVVVGKKAKYLPIGEVQFCNVLGEIAVANMFAQHNVFWDGNVPPIRYDALSRCLDVVAEVAKEHDCSIHTDEFGKGYAGADWRIIDLLFEKYIPKKVKCYIYRDVEKAPTLIESIKEAIGV